MFVNTYLLLWQFFTHILQIINQNSSFWKKPTFIAKDTLLG